ncbi:hypothetical protein ACFX13_039236 [Malus domestica]
MRSHVLEVLSPRHNCSSAHTLQLQQQSALDEAARRCYSNESKLCIEEFVEMMQQQVNSGDVACSCHFPQP